MNKEQAIQRIEDLLSRANRDNPLAEGVAFGFIQACLHMSLINFEEAYVFQMRALGLPVE